MNKRFVFTFSIVAIAFAFLIGFGSVDGVKASDDYNLTGQVNVIAQDEAFNTLVPLVTDRDRGEAFVFPSHAGPDIR